MSATAPARPHILAPALAGIPAELRAREQWVGFRLELVKWKWTKVPANARTGAKASTTDTSTWSPIDDALAGMTRFGFDGIGYVFSPDDPFCGIDYDDCRAADGTIFEEVQDELADLATYSEWSCSGTGIHAIAQASIQRAGKKPHVEVYDRGRFFVVTGHRLDWLPATIEGRQAIVDALHLRHFGPEDTTPPSPNGHRPHADLTDGEIVRLASEAKNGDKFRRLYFDGDTSAYGGDDSAAVEALACLIVFYTRDVGQVERIFGRSELGQRDKWRQRADYRERTIEAALDVVTETYTPKNHAQTPHDATDETDKRASGSFVSAAGETGRSKPAWPALDDAAFCGLVGDVVSAIDAHTEADRVATLATFMLMFGSAAGRSPHLMVGNDRHGLNEFAAFVGETAKARKGSSQGGPRCIHAYADQAWERERVQGGLSSGEGLLAAIADPIIRVNKKGEEETVFEGSKDRRLLCIEEELSQLLKVAGRQGNTISEIVRRGWDSRETLRTMTKASPMTVTGPHISIIGHITADELRRELDDTARANGFGNRFLWLCVRRSKAEPFLDPLPDVAVVDLGRRVQQALVHARKTTRVQLDDTARVMWREVYPDLSEGRPGLVGSLTARAEAHTLRLALTYALLDRASAISGDHLIAALAFIEYVEASVRYVFGDATGDPVADRILAALRANGPMTQNAIYDFFGRNVSSNRIGLALETLLTASLVRMSKEETAGRPRTIWAATA